MAKKSRTKGQHFLPRVLLKGFAEERKKRKFYTVLYRVRSKPVSTNIANVGKGHLFYGEPGETGIEDSLSNEETLYGPTLDALRRGEPLTGDHLESVLRLVANLTIRTDHLRSGFGDAASQVLEVLEAALSGDKAWEVLQGQMRRDPSILQDVIRCAGPTVPALRRMHPRDRLALERSLDSALPALMDSQKEAVLQGVRPVLPAVRATLDFRSLAKGAHVRVLGNSGAPAARIEAYRALTWCIVTRSPCAFILGDFGPLGLRNGGDYRPLSVLGQALDSVYLPISDTQLLVGHRGNETPTVDPDAINEATAESSRDFFVSRCMRPATDRLAVALGTRAALVTPAELTEISRSALSGEPGAPETTGSDRAARLHGLTLAAVTIDGPEDGLTKRAQVETEGFLSGFEGMGNELGLPIATRLSAVVTSSMGASVDSVRERYGLSMATPYSSERYAVAVRSKVMASPKFPPLDATILLDTALWRGDSPWDQIVRVHVLSYAVAQVLTMADAAFEAGHQRDRQRHTFRADLEAEAARLLDTHDCILKADEIVRALLKPTTDDGKVIGVSALLSDGFTDATRVLLSKLCTVAQCNIQQYRTSGVGLDELLPAVMPVVMELVSVLAHVIALAEDDAAVERITATLRATPGFAEYMADDWGSTVAAFKHEDRNAAVKSLVVAIENILARLGLYVEVLPDEQGHYIQVGEPNLVAASPA